MGTGASCTDLLDDMKIFARQRRLSRWMWNHGAFILRNLCHISRLLYTPRMVQKLTAVRIKEKTLAELSKIAKREDETVSETILRALDDFLRREANAKR